jgi:hypothetical protein
MSTVFGVCPVHGAVAMWADESLVPFERQVCATLEHEGNDVELCLLDLDLQRAPTTTHVPTE